MTLSNGSRLGPYEIVSRLGTGGMGEVWRARDTRLDRTVAIKVLPVQFAQDAQLRLRLDREAKSISQLNHAHICTLHDIGHADGIDYLVMEFIEGETLADRLRHGPLSVPDVIRFGAQVADALAQAHRAGIVHRDLKPGNIMITKSGAKLLDFGLARPSPAAVVADDATQHKPLTAEHAVVGTYQYMSPEQCAGEPVDARSDIFSFGVVLYEMLTGTPAFHGRTTTSMVAAIMGAEPPEVTGVQPRTPPALAHVISTCLQKDPDERWQSAKDVREELQWIASSSPETRTTRSVWLPAAAIAILVLALAAALVSRGREKPETLTLDFAPPHGFQFDRAGNSPFAISPDGKSVVFVASEPEGELQLWLRRFSDTAPVPIRGTTAARAPFWSHDGRSIGFVSRNSVMRVAVAGGDPRGIAEETIPTVGPLGAWSAGDIVIFPTRAGIQAVSAGGGAPSLVLPASANERYFRPSFIGASDRFLVTRILTDGSRTIIAASLAGGPPKTVLNNATNSTYTDDGRLIFVSGGALLVQKFDARELEVRGEPRVIAPVVGFDNQGSAALYSASRAGHTLVYKETAFLSDLMVVDRGGHPIAVAPAAQDLFDPALSNDGSRVAYKLISEEGVTSDIWIRDVDRGAPVRLTSGRTNKSAPIWSPDDSRLVLSVEDDLFLMPASGGQLEMLVESAAAKFASDWSPDGQYILYSERGAEFDFDIVAVSVADRVIIPVVKTTYSEAAARFSPDGKWIAYSSFESGAGEVYVQRFPEGSERTRVSPNGGLMPQWSDDGRELYFVSGGKLVSSEVRMTPRFQASLPRPLFDLATVFSLNAAYAPFPDGRRLLVAQLSEPSQVRFARVILNWDSGSSSN